MRLIEIFNYHLSTYVYSLSFRLDSLQKILMKFIRDKLHRMDAFIKAKIVIKIVDLMANNIHSPLFFTRPAIQNKIVATNSVNLGLKQKTCNLLNYFKRIGCDIVTERMTR